MTSAPAAALMDTSPLLRRELRRERGRWFVRVLVCCLLIEALPMVTAPGNVIADTKLDLAVAPVRFLARALNLWDPQQFGQLQNQAVGYLFPMGPFFALGHLAGLPPWVVQRLWIGAVAVAAFLGTVLLAGRLGIGTPRARLFAGFAYALSPAGLTLLGTLSSEFLPAALLPWILLPLVGVGRGSAPPSPWGRTRPFALHARRRPPGRPRPRRLWQAAARSAVAVALCGGINGTATFAVLLPAVLAILTLPRGAPRWRLLAWWAPAVLLVTCWWSVPLLLLSKYGVSVVPYTESAAATTSVTSLSDILRGTENWVSYLVVNGQAWWQLGYRVATDVLPTLASGLVAALGLSGLVSRGLPARRFLLCSVLLGVLIISSGYVSSFGNPLAGPVDHLINGAASPFRNVRKFDPMIRLPVALGLAHYLSSVRAPWLRSAREQLRALLPHARPATAVAARPPGASLNLVAGLAIAVLALPGYLGGLANPGSFQQVPGYWVAAANWLDSHAGHQAVLVEPGAPFSQYVWGSPLDDVLEPLGTVDWAERDISLLGSAGNERLLDAIDEQLAAGEGSAGLAPVLARMGVKYVLVRNDLSRSVLAGAWPSLISQALADSPGITKAAQFGPLIGNATPDDAATNFDPPFPAVEVYQVAGAEPVATVQPAEATVRVYGGPEALLTLASEGLVSDQPVLLDADSPGLAVAGSVVTDSLRRRLRNFGELRSEYSPTLTAHQVARTFEAADDYTEPGWHGDEAVAQYHGIADVTASSSDAGIEAIPAQWASGVLAYSAVDGDPRTVWESGSWHGPIGQWIQVGFDHPVDPGTVRVTFVDQPVVGPPVTRVTVRTAAGQAADQVRATGQSQPLRVPPGPSRWLRITITGLAYRPHPFIGPQVGISEISVPGVHASRTIMAPAVLALGTGGPQAVVLAKAEPQPPGCMLTSLRWVCAPSLSAATEEQYGFDEGFTAAGAGQEQLRGSAVLVSPALVARYTDVGVGNARVVASSVYTGDPQDQARSAFDGNPATSWVAGLTDPHPTLKVGWPRMRRVSEVTIQRPPGASGALQVLLAGTGGHTRGGVVGPSGALRFAPMRTKVLRMVFTPAYSPLQVSDVFIPGVPELGTLPGEFRLHCGLGPLLDVDGHTVPTRAWGTFADLLTGRPVSFAACAPASVATGANAVVEPGSDGFDVQDVVLERQGSGAGPFAAPGHGAGPLSSARVVMWTPSRRVVAVTARSRSYLVVNENFNGGWRAVVHGRRLWPVRLDGWKQAWLLPAGTSGVVTLSYTPVRPYREAIGAGLGCVALAILLAAWPVTGRRSRRAAGTTGAGPARKPLRNWRVRIALAGRAWPAHLRLVRSRPHLSNRVLRVSWLARMVVAAGVLLVAGVWLGGYAGAFIVTLACAAFVVAARRPGQGLLWRGLRQTHLLAGVLIAAFICGAVGEHLLRAGGSGPAVHLLAGIVPQALCLVAVARLAAALLGDRRPRAGWWVPVPSRPAQEGVPATAPLVAGSIADVTPGGGGNIGDAVPGGAPDTVPGAAPGETPSGV
ncbi:MAG TPA: alpha-(1-_3)-arabinofuranosyltransferase family protein [Streptosporangiaceae bacterium]|nr:alpha-(1->3)-arabinofuranosyltransferase family protein [Streptosporangiaceae bacterium]